MTSFTAPPNRTGLILNAFDRLDVFSGGTATGTIINENAVENVNPGGKGLFTIVNGGVLNVGDTGIGTTINGGNENVFAAGTVTDTTINTGGTELLNAGTTAVDSIVNVGGLQSVLGTAIGTIINEGGLQSVSGTAEGTIINGGLESISSGGMADGVNFIGPHSTLALATPSGLTGFIRNWHVGDVIDFLNTTVTGAIETASTLTVTYGDHQTASYSLAGKQANTEFRLQLDGNGGTELNLQPVVTSSASAHLLSLAGGGIKAMTADAGLFAGLLEHFSSEGAPTTIGNLLSKESAVSANSGSSWFTDLLAYSQSFDNSLQNYSQLFSPNGYMGELQTAYYNYATAPNTNINKVIVAILNGIGDLAGMNLGQIYGLLANSSINWNDFLNKGKRCLYLT
jgi:autotransporter passenger strand-loop-strand repeat protein